MDNRKFDFTYLSDNIEKHAEPNNSSLYTKYRDLKTGCHPFLKSIPLFAISEEDKELFNALERAKFIKYDKH